MRTTLGESRSARRPTRTGRRGVSTGVSTSSVSADVPTADTRGRERAAESFADFVAARLGALTRTAVLLCGDRTLADDLVQSALVKTAAAWPRVETNPDAYVRRAMYHEQISWWRRRSRRPELLTDQPPEPRAPAAGDTEQKLVLAAALRRLTPKQRAVLVLRFYDDLSVAETAEVLGVATGTVKSQTRLALDRLRSEAPELADLVGSGGNDTEGLT